MIRNVRFAISSILSVVILISLIFFFGTAFAIILLIYFLARIYKKLTFNKKNEIQDDDHEKKETIDVDDDNYKIN